MLHPKACPRCSGDLSLVQDIGDTYYSCVQCGAISYQVPVRITEPVQAASRAATKRAA